MIQFLQTIFLSEVLIFVILAGAFLYLSRRAISLQEYAGYGLGILIGLFFMVVYSSTGAQPPIEAQTVEAPVTLTFFQVLMPTLCGTGLGLGLLYIISMARTGRRRTLVIAVFTALNVVLLFLMLVADSETRRMIGIFALAFAICALFVLVVFGRADNVVAGSFGAQSAPPKGAIPSRSQSRLQQMRDEVKDRFRQD